MLHENRASKVQDEEVSNLHVTVINKLKLRYSFLQVFTISAIITYIRPCTNRMSFNAMHLPRSMPAEFKFRYNSRVRPTYQQLQPKEQVEIKQSLCKPYVICKSYEEYRHSPTHSQPQHQLQVSGQFAASPGVGGEGPKVPNLQGGWSVRCGEDKTVLLLLEIEP